MYTTPKIEKKNNNLIIIYGIMVKRALAYIGALLEMDAHLCTWTKIINNKILKTWRMNERFVLRIRKIKCIFSILFHHPFQSMDFIVNCFVAKCYHRYPSSLFRINLSNVQELEHHNILNICTYCTSQKLCKWHESGRDLLLICSGSTCMKCT